jgi:hypothetical protein
VIATVALHHAAELVTSIQGAVMPAVTIERGEFLRPRVFSAQAGGGAQTMQSARPENARLQARGANLVAGQDAPPLSRKGMLMRRTLILLLAAGVTGMGLGCSRTLQHTAGVCDCDPPCVESVLKPYAGITPAAPTPAPTLAMPITAPANMPHAAEPPK